MHDGIELAERFFGAERLNADLRSIFAGIYRAVASSCLLMRATVCGQQFSVVADTGADQSAMTLPLYRRLHGALPYNHTVIAFHSSAC